MITFTPKTGLVALADTPFDKGRVVFRFREFSCASDQLRWRKSGAAFVAAALDCEFRISTPRGALKIELKNKAGSNRFLVEVRIVFSPEDMDDPPACREFREYIHSFSLGKGSGAKKVGLATRWMENNPESSMAYALQHIATGRAVLVANAPPLSTDFLTFRALHADAHMEGAFGLLIRSDQQKLLKPGRKAAVSPIQCLTGDDPIALLEELGQRWAKALGRDPRERRVGWNSWDYYAGAVTAENIYANQREAKRRFRGRVRCFVIDEGWEPRWGDWVANWKFPKGTKAFCRKIKAGGGVPGVWTAPLLVNKYTGLFRDNPGWFARDAEGQVAGSALSYGPMAFLDVTHPEADEFLEGVFRRLRRDGFEYFKVDFTQCVLDAALFHDMSVGRGGILRKAFETIRRGVGPDAYVLACGAPYESVVGLVDAVRTTGDIHDFWCHVKRNAPSIAARWWMHGALWNNDPDFLIVRSEDTSPDPQLRRAGPAAPMPPTGIAWLGGRPFTINEVRAYALLVYLSGGDIILGDDLAQLNKEGLDIIRKVLDTPNTRAAVPLDLFARHDAAPALWIKEEDDFHLIAVFNWEEDPKDCEIDLNAVALREHGRVRAFWSGQTVTPVNNAVSMRLDPRSCEALMIFKK